MPVGDARVAPGAGGKPSLPAEITEQLELYHQELDLPEGDTSLDVAVWFYTGQSARADGRADEAVACFKKVIELTPDDPWPYWELAEIYAEQSAPPAAVMVLSALGERLMGQQRWPEAIAAWKRASELAPDDVDVLEALREAYVRIGRLPEANQVQSTLQAHRLTAQNPAQRTQDARPASTQRAPAAQPAPAPAEETQSVWPTPAEGTQDIWPTPAEGTQDVWPTPASAEETRDVWPTPVEGTQDVWQAPAEATEDAWPPPSSGIQDAWPTPTIDLSPSPSTDAPARPAPSGTRAPAGGSAGSGTQAPAGPAPSGTRTPAGGSAGSGTQAPAGPAPSGTRAPAGGSTGSGTQAPAGPAAPAKKPADGDGGGPAAQPDLRAGEGVVKGKSTREPLLRKILLAHGWVTEEQVKQAVDIQRRGNGRLGRILVEMEAVSENQLAQGLAELWGLKYTDLADTNIDPLVARTIPAYLARRHGVVAVTRKSNTLVVAMSDPSNVVAIDDIRLLTGMEVEVIIASAAAIARAQGLAYGGGGDIEEMFKGTDAPEIAEERAEETNLESLRTAVEEAPIIRAVNQILGQAIQSGASDIHIEPHRQDVKVRLRIDGVLQDIMSPPKSVQAPLVSRVKILADMDIAERRLPQDGHIHVRAEGREYDLRVSTLPTVLGEKVVIRILDQSSTKTELHNLGFASDLLAVWEGLITKPYGMILVTGPTGSGKTTTLYTSLARINTPERNIVSVENPVEYQIPRVNQVQVNPKIGLTFASGLRTILRQDPDVVLIGEIRDKETAEIAVQASMTGHLVLSTVHTNDAPGAVTRLRDIGIEPFLITSSLIGVLAQRLVRVICNKCKEAYTPPVDALRRLELEGDVGDLRLYRGRGCDACRRTGYKGRVGVFELMVMNDRLRDLAVKGGSTEDLRRAALEQGMRTLKQDAIQKVLEGITSFEEMLRVVFVSEAAEE